MDTIKIDIDVEAGEISVFNNGRGIPIEIHDKVCSHLNRSFKTNMNFLNRKEFTSLNSFLATYSPGPTTTMLNAGSQVAATASALSLPTSTPLSSLSRRLTKNPNKSISRPGQAT